MDDKRGSRRLTAGVLFVLAVALIGPAIPYVWTFGLYPSGDHARWGQFGDYYGALLSVLLGALTVLLLLAQLHETRKSARDQAIAAALQLRHARATTDAAHDAVFVLETHSADPASRSPTNADAARLTLANYGAIVLNVSVEPVSDGIRAEFAHTDWLPVLKPAFPINIYISPPPTQPVQFRLFVQRRDGQPRRHLMLFEPIEGRLSTMMVDDDESIGEVVD